MRLLTCRPFLLTDEVIDLITLEVIPLPSVNQPSTVFSWPVAIAPVVWLSSFPVSFNKAEKGCYRHSMQRFCLLKNTRGLQKHKPEAYHLLRNKQASFRKQRTLLFSCLQRNVKCSLALQAHYLCRKDINPVSLILLQRGWVLWHGVNGF